MVSQLAENCQLAASNDNPEHLSKIYVTMISSDSAFAGFLILYFQFVVKAFIFQFFQISQTKQCTLIADFHTVSVWVQVLNKTNLEKQTILQNLNILRLIKSIVNVELQKK